MKKLQDFECEKVEIKTVYGGYVEPGPTIIYQGTEVCEVRTDN
ncbi:hypothetical protein ABXT06_05145 [Flavobacterium sp. UW10123]